MDTATIVLLIYLVLTLIFSVLFFIYFFKNRALRKKYSAVDNIDDYENNKRTEADQHIEKAKIRIAEKVDEARSKLQKSESENNKILESIASLQDEYRRKRNRLVELEEALLPIEDINDISEVGFSELKFQFDDHAQYVVALKRIREDQKDLHRAREAVFCPNNWTVEGSAAKGKQMIDRCVRLTLRAFNNECDVLISKVTFKNAASVKKRIRTAKDAFDKLNESLNVWITDEYVTLKFREVDLVAEEKIKKEEEKQRLRDERDAEREEARAQKEITDELKRREKEENAQQRALEEVKNKLKIASAEHRDALLAEAAEIEDKLATASREKGKLVSMAQYTKVGHLYVISNKGSFGEKIVKIGMTRRLEPMDRVKELGDASVPFPFDVHAIVFSEDAPNLERELHQVFDAKRVNKVNTRKEFFELPLTEVHEELKKRIPNVPFNYIINGDDLARSAAQQNSPMQNKASNAFTNEI